MQKVPSTQLPVKSSKPPSSTKKDTAAGYVRRIGDFQKQHSIFAPLFTNYIPAGFPSPADDHLDQSLDLNEHLIKHPAATFFCRVSGDSMQELGVQDKDLLIIDRAMTPSHGDIVLAALDGQLTCKLLDTHKRRLLSSNKRYPPIPIPEDSSLIIEGVVTCSISQFK